MDVIRIERTGGIAVVTLDRPPANALDPTLLDAGLNVLTALRDDPPGAVVLCGNGAFFSGGADLEVVPSLGAEDQARMARGVNDLFIGWYGFPRPVVCAVNGHAVAGGLVLALCGDHRVASISGQFGLTEVKVGIPYPPAAMAVVEAELTPAAARRLVLRGKLFDSTAMLDLGVFDEVVADDDVLARAFEVAAEMAQLPPSTFAIVKRSLRRVGLERAQDRRPEAKVKGWVTDEATEASASVLDKRKRT